MSTRKPNRAHFFLRTALAVALLAATGCVSSAWNRALEEDTPAAYHRFMRDHGESEYAESARERLDFHKLKRNPTLAGFETFKKNHPGSPLISLLHPVLEKPAFEAARAQGTAKAYREFAAAMQKQLFDELEASGGLILPIRRPKGARLDQRKLRR